MSTTTPIFINPTLNTSVSQHATKGAKLAFVPAIDPGNNKITYSIISGNINSAFLVDSLGSIKVNNRTALDFYEATPQFQLVVQASNGISNAFHTVNFQFIDPIRTIIDTNRKSNNITDQFKNGDLVNITVSARDGREIETHVQYSLSNDAGGRFAIDASTGVVTVKNAVLLSRDAGNAASYTITIKALNSDGISTMSKNFLIRVSDTNNLQGIPINDLDTRDNLVLPNAAKGTLVGITANIIDPDPYYLNPTITYSLSDPLKNKLGTAFSIDPITGVVSVNNGTLLKVGMTDTITVTARTADKEFTTQTFTIKVVPQIGPIISATEPSRALLESGGVNNQTAGISSATSQVSISSWDGTTPISFDTNYLLSQGWQEDVPGQSYLYIGTYGTVFFDITAQARNVIYVLAQSKGSTQALTQGQHVSETVTFRVIDSHNLTADKTIAFNITGTNDFPKTLAVTIVAMQEDTGPRLITQAELNARATDVDGNVFVASGLAISAGNGNLVNNHNGTWSYTPVLNDDTSVSFTYTITDGFFGTVSGSATLDISSVNDAPNISLSGAPSSLTENGGVNNGTVGVSSSSVTLIKSDVDSTVMFSPGAGWFSADSGVTYTNTGVYGTATFVVSTGLLSYSLRNDDPDTQKLISGQQVNDTFVMGVQDLQNAANSASISFMINGANDNPNNILLSAASVPENTPSNSIVALLSANDPDAGNTFSFSLVPGGSGVDADNYRFEILNGNELHLISGQTLDYEALINPNLSLNLRVTDNTGLSFDKAVTLNVTGVNEAPTSIIVNSGIALNIDENVRYVVPLSAVDPDQNSTFTFQLFSGVGGNDANNNVLQIFTIAGFSYLGSISLDGFNFETNPVIKFNLQVTDNGSPGLTHTQAFDITVNDVNEAPVATPDTFSIDDASGNLNIVSVIANDFDPDAGQAGTAISVNDIPSWQITSARGIPVILNASAGTFVYQYSNQFIAMNPGESVTDTFTYTLQDSLDNSLRSTATVSVTINGSDTVLPSIFSTGNDVVDFRDPQVNFIQYDPTQFYNALAGDDQITLPNQSSSIVIANQFDSSQIFSAGPGDDVVIGGDGGDIIFGGEGDDTISGFKGDDLIYGGAGSDILTGIEGNDKFVYVTQDDGGVNGDQITDFTSGQDLLYFSKAGFLGFVGFLGVVEPAPNYALDPNSLSLTSNGFGSLHNQNYFVYDTAIHTLYYNDNPIANQAFIAPGVLLATFAAGIPPLTANDFLFF